jgi:hypothetical protein
MDLHPPEGGIHSWRDFFVHMATIVLGIMIAIGLEQTLEAIHHRHQQAHVEADLDADIRGNLSINAFDLRRSAEVRSYLMTLRNSVDARRQGKPAATVNSRPMVNLIHPRMAAWDAAKESGELALLPPAEIRMYDRFLFQMSQLDRTVTEYHDCSLALQDFEERFIDAPGGFDYGLSTTPPDLSRMSAEDLAEYSKLLSGEIVGIDRMVARFRFEDAEDRALSEGAKTDEELVQRAMKISVAR